MSYFPKNVESAPYFCPNCEVWFVRPLGFSTSCCVLHRPGSCCHMGESQAEAPQDAPKERE